MNAPVRDITPAVRPAQDVLASLSPNAGSEEQLIVRWFALLSEGRLTDAWKLMDPTGSYFLLRQRKTISIADFTATMDGLIGSTFTRAIQWSLGTITAQDERLSVIASSHVPLVAGGAYENLYHFLFRIVGDKIVEGYEFADTFRSAQTFAAPPGEA